MNEKLEVFIMNCLSNFQIESAEKSFESFPIYKKRYNKALEKYTKRITKEIKR